MAEWHRTLLGKCFVISIPRLEKRLINFNKAWGENFAELHLGIDYLETDLYKECIKYNITPVGLGKFPPILSIFISHYTLWRKVLDENISKVTIFEDDALPTGEQWLTNSSGFTKWFTPKNTEDWIGTACYTITKHEIIELLSSNLARSPDWHLYKAGFTKKSVTSPVYVDADPSYFLPPGEK